MLDLRALFQSYDKSSGSPRDAVKLKESSESASFVNANELVHVHKRWRHCHQRGCHCLQPMDGTYKLPSY